MEKNIWQMKEVQVYKHRSCFLIRYLEMVTNSIKENGNIFRKKVWIFHFQQQ